MKAPDTEDVTGRIRDARGYVFDLDGTLVLGDKQNNEVHALPGAVELLALLDARAVPYVVMTNGTVRTPSGISGELAKAGLRIPAGKIMTPATVAADYFVARKLQRILVLGVEGVWRPMADAGLDVILPGRGDSSGESADAVFVGWYRRIDMDEIEVACNAVWNGARLFCASMAPFFATRHGRALGSSRAISAMITSVTSRRVNPLGKPSVHVLKGAAKRFGCKRSELVVVGDDPELEIGMARHAGATAVALHSGVAGEAAFAALPATRRPHLSFPGAAEFHDWLAGLAG